MNSTIKSIINGDDENKKRNTMKTDLQKTVELLEDLRIEFSHKMEKVLKPIYKKEHDPLDVLLIEDLKLVDRMILVILRNRENSTLDQLMVLSGCNKQTCNTSLNRLRNAGLVIKLKMSTYSINEIKIY